MQLIADQLRTLIREYFAQLAGEVEFPAATSSEPEFVADQDAAASDRIDHLTEKLENDEFGSAERFAANSLAKGGGVDWPSLTATQQAFVLRGMTRAQIEQARQFRYRLENETGPYTPSDVLFAADSSIAAPKASEADKPMSAIVGLYIKSRVDGGYWTSKTAAAQTRVLNAFTAHAGPETPINSVTTKHVREFRGILTKLRRGYVLNGQPPASGVTDDIAKRVSSKTADKNLGFAKSLLKWAVDEGHAASVVGTSIVVKAPASKGLPPRRPFTQNELKTIFSSPAFKGHRANKLHKEGPVLTRGSFFWILLIALHTGARLGEIVQLRGEDVANLDGIDLFRIKPSKASPDAKVQTVKNYASIREVPIHPKLIQLGFLKFVEATKSSERVFSDIAYGADGIASTVFSKRVNRYLDRIGLTDPTITFHSFRHTLKDALRNQQIQPYVIDALLGHTPATVGESYGIGPSLPVRLEGLSKVNFDLELAPQ